MLKSAVLLAVPGTLGGVGLLYAPSGSPGGPLPLRDAYVVQVGVAFTEAAVQGVLPEGLEPAAGFTGGIAVYGGDEGWVLSPLSTGYVWVDVTRREGGDEASRYMVLAFASERPEDIPAVSLASASASTAPPAGEGALQALASPDAVSLLELTVRPSAGICTSSLVAERGDLLTSGLDGSLGVVHLPVVLDLCEAEALTARVSAPPDHLLGTFAPERVLWAAMATPLGQEAPEPGAD